MSKFLTYQTVRLFWTRAPSSAEKVAAFSRIWSEASPAMTLWTAVDFRKLLAILRPLAPATILAGLVARGAISLGLLEVVDVVVFAERGDDLRPLDRLDVAQVVVVHDAHTAIKNFWKKNYFF